MVNESAILSQTFPSPTCIPVLKATKLGMSLTQKAIPKMLQIHGFLKCWFYENLRFYLFC